MVKNVLNTLRKKQKNNKGFSLVELIVVIAIMAVLVGVLAPQFIKYVERSRQSTDVQNVQLLKDAIEAEASDNERITEATITFSVKSGTTGTKATTVTGALTPSDITISSSKSTVTLKSSGWNTGVYTYTPSDGKWVKTTPVGTNSNGGSSAKNMDDVFD